MILESRFLALGLLWCGTAFAEIPAGYELVKITENPNDFSHRAHINNCGEVVFSIRFADVIEDEEIFRYDNGLLRQLTSNAVRDALPVISDNGTIAWARFIEWPSNGEIVRLVAGQEQVIGPGSGPAINDVGHITWHLGPEESPPCAHLADIMLFDGEEVVELFSDGLSNQAVAINDADTILWSNLDFCADPTTVGVLGYWNGSVQEVSEPDVQSGGASLNNVGTVAWSYSTPQVELGIKILEDGKISVLTEWGSNQQLNDVGDVYFIRWHEDSESWQAWLFRDGDFLQLTDEPEWNTDGDINNDGEIAWKAKRYPESDIHLLRRIRTGEADFDGHVDLRDAVAFQNCMTGPGDFDGTVGGFDRLCDCRFLDIDHDRDVDRDDYALFAPAMTGPQ